MLRLWVALGAFVTLAATGVACGSSTPPTPTAAPEPTPTERPQAAPTEKPQATPTGKSQVTPTAKPQVTSTERPQGTSTERPQGTSTERPQVTPTERPHVAPTEKPQVDPQEADALRKLAFAYWEAFNAYDADRALGYLEEDYRQQQDSAVRDDIGMIKLFSVKLGVSEETPPQVVGNDEWEMYLTMKEPLGTRRIRMGFRKVAGDWKIIFAEEAK